MLIERGRLAQSRDIAALILASEPRLLSFLFGGEAACLDYLEAASGQTTGQFSADSHYTLKISDKQQGNENDAVPVGIYAAWHANMSIEFTQGTLSSLRAFLSTEQLIHLLAYNEALEQCFAPPLQHQFCLGHISVVPHYRRMGLATKLIEHAAKEALKLSKTELILDVDCANIRAINCYLKAGFKPTTQTHFEPTQQTFSRMVLALSLNMYRLSSV